MALAVGSEAVIGLNPEAETRFGGGQGYLITVVWFYSTQKLPKGPSSRANLSGGSSLPCPPKFLDLCWGSAVKTPRPARRAYPDPCQTEYPWPVPSTILRRYPTNPNGRAPPVKKGTPKKVPIPLLWQGSEQFVQTPPGPQWITISQDLGLTERRGNGTSFFFFFFFFFEPLR